MIRQIREGFLPVLGLTAFILFGAVLILFGLYVLEEIAYGLAWMFTNLPGVVP